MNKSEYQAQQVAQLLGNDGQRWETDNGIPLETLALDQDAIKEFHPRDGFLTRFVFPDDSVLVMEEGGMVDENGNRTPPCWGIRRSTCWFWLGGGPLEVYEKSVYQELTREEQTMKPYQCSAKRRTDETKQIVKGLADVTAALESMTAVLSTSL